MRRSPAKAHRRATRHSVRLECQVVRERDFQLVADRIVNLSTSGILVSPADRAEHLRHDCSADAIFRGILYASFQHR